MRERMTSIGTKVPRAHDAKRYTDTGARGGNSIISGGPAGSAAHGYLPSTASPPWTAWGPWVSAPPLTQVDTNAAETAKHYRVVAPFSPPPP